ncbi:MAG: hypothetical protein AB9Q19_00490 [Candidatus Reddybacter sp.]
MNNVRLSLVTAAGVAVGFLFLDRDKTAGALELTPVGENIPMKNFTPQEFGEWWPLMSPELLVKLDYFRDLWRAPVLISTAPGGIGRHLGDDGTQHNVDLWGQVNAIDIFPVEGTGYVDSVEGRARMLQIAKKAGFSGIGIYTDTAPGNMLHVDVRADKSSEFPAMWSRINGEYKSILRVV